MLATIQVVCIHGICSWWIKSVSYVNLSYVKLDRSMLYIWVHVHVLLLKNCLGDGRRARARANLVRRKI